MECKKDLIIERSNKGLCPMCNKVINTNFKIMKYRKVDIRICKNHHYLRNG